MTTESGSVEPTIDYTETLNQILQNQKDFKTDFGNFNQSFSQNFSQFQEDLQKYHDSVIKFQDGLSKSITDNHIEVVKNLHTINDSITSLDSDVKQLNDSFNSVSDVMSHFSSVDWNHVFSTVKEFSKIYSTVHFSIGVLLGSLCAMAFVLGLNKI
ncbi:hypothetical protein [Bacillus smithii]|uniref:hypothetical protein n=1 Tax=Bacillus smithii TaxID=1479 RepID=UPI003D208922